MMNAIFSQFKLPFFSRVVPRKKPPLNTNRLRSGTQHPHRITHADFESSMAFAHSCYDPNDDLAQHAKSSDAAMAYELQRNPQHCSGRRSTKK